MTGNKTLLLQDVAVRKDMQGYDADWEAILARYGRFWEACCFR